MEAFTFGEPSAVLDRRDILDYVECINNGKWYEPLVNFSGLAKSLRALGAVLMQLHQQPRAVSVPT